MAGLVVRPRARILHGHDWVYSSEVLKVFGAPADGDVISIKDGRDRLLGTAIYNSKSQIIARRLSRRRQDLDAEFLSRRITQAIEWRERSGCNLEICRLVWSEADGLPGVIIDRYGDVAVLQTLAYAMDLQKQTIADILAGLPGIQHVVERNDAPVRTLEGLPLTTGMLVGTDPGTRIVRLGKIDFEVDFLGGQKTGLYLDQAENYAIVAKHASGRTVLDCFANQGGFALACAAEGATSVTAVESGAASISRLQANTTRNGLAVQAVDEDVFKFLADAERREEKYDLIILDPPSFTRAKGRINDALRGYRDLHTRAARVLAPGGLIATFSCSHHVSSAEFESAVAEGLADGRRTMRVIDRLVQSRDHPVPLHLPETFYLKGLLLEAMPGR